MTNKRQRQWVLHWVGATMVLAGLACSRPGADSVGVIDFRGRVTPIGSAVEAAQQAANAANIPATLQSQLAATYTPFFAQPLADMPTPDPTRPGSNPQNTFADMPYFVSSGETFGSIADQFSISVEQLLAYNKLTGDALLQVGQMLIIPLKDAPQSPAIKLLPDSELVYGPGAAQFDVAGFIQQQGGYLASYTQQDSKTGVLRSGAEIVQLVAQRYSVNPRLLLALLEFHSGWVTQANPPAEKLDYPMGQVEAGREGLLSQLAFAANALNNGFYAYREAGLSSIQFVNQSVVQIAPGLNAATAALQRYLALQLDPTDWVAAAQPTGAMATYQSLFGDPFQYRVEPLIPPDLAQPEMSLPWAAGETWYFTGGPHGGWDTGSSWAAIDFAPADVGGCEIASNWARAVASGLVVRSYDGVVAQDLDGDGFEQTGWAVLYVHVDSSERVQPGTYLQTGDPIGHPSCEGGVSNGTHLHLARKYNGVWLNAGLAPAFNLSGWSASSSGNEYDGFLQRDNTTLEAWNGRAEGNAISR